MKPNTTPTVPPKMTLAQWVEVSQAYAAHRRNTASEELRELIAGAQANLNELERQQKGKGR